MKDIIAYQVNRELDEHQLDIYEETFAPLEPALNMALEQGKWQFSAFFDADYAQDKIMELLEKADSAAGISGQSMVLTPVADQDWQQKALEDFPPLHIGSFFIHSFEETVPEGSVDLYIPANMAFGTGEHPTTSGCLALYEALTTGRMDYEVLAYKDSLNKDKPHTIQVKTLAPFEPRSFENALDMGCGSAILAMAVAKKDGVPVLGVDIDQLSVDVSQENVVLNRVQGVSLACGDGFKAPEVGKSAPFDLIFANILMQPLIDMSAELVAAMQPSGVAILSGFLQEQRSKIVETYTQLGLQPVAEVSNAPWSAVAFRKVS